MELFPVPHEIMSHSKSITVEETFSCLSQLQTQDTSFAPRSVTFRREGGARHFHADQQGSLSCVMSSCVCIILYLWTYQLKSGSYLVIFGNICAAAAACGTYLECLEGLHDCGWRLVAPLLLPAATPHSHSDTFRGPGDCL